MVNLEELSAKELYELAKEKEREEERVAQMQAQLNELAGKRESMVKEYQQGLAYIDRQIDELNAQRQEMAESHQKALVAIDRELNKLRSQCEEKKANKSAIATPSKASAPAPATTAKLEREPLTPPVPEAAEEQGQEKRKRNGEADDLALLMEHIFKIMKGRNDISESLLREKLNLAKFRPANLSKLLDTLVRQAKLGRKSGGNYILGKAAKKR